KELVLDRRVAHAFATVQEMAHARAAFLERAADQQAAVAGERIALGAHQRNPIGLRPLDDALEALGERRRLRHLLVVRDAVRIELAFRRPAAELPAEEHVGDPGTAEVVAQRIAVELRRMARIWRAAHVGDGRDAGAAQQRDEALGRMAGMSDGEDLGRHGPAMTADAGRSMIWRPNRLATRSTSSSALLPRS